MTATASTAHERTIDLRIDIDQLAKIGSALALGSAVLAVAGVLSVGTYLSAWAIPAPLIRMDPLTAALRSETVVWQFAVLAVIVFGVDALAHRIGGRRLARIGVVVGVAVPLAYLGADLWMGGYVGPVITIVGGVALAVIHHRRGLSPRVRLIAFASIALVSAGQTGIESGRLIRDDRAWQTPVTLTSRVPIGGLAGGVESGGAWQYRDLYLVFRDGEAVYISRPGAGSNVWIVPAMHVMSMGIGAGA